jgi:L-lactate utilization protein LutB
MTPIQIRNQKLGRKLVSALESRRFEAYYCDTRDEAVQLALSLIPADHIVTWGGSATLTEIGLLDLVKNQFRVIDRDLGKDKEEKTQLMRQALLADTYLTSANAISEDGQIVNIDGTGNRVAATVFGPSNVVFVIGMNKVCKTVEDAWSRARNFAAPANAQRFENLETPCSINGTCSDCKSDNCICAYLLTTRFSKPAKKIKVILVNENLGF